jgi:hypothetical protein
MAKGGAEAAKRVRQVMRELEQSPELRSKVYAELAAKGVDVKRLVADAKRKGEPVWPTAPTPERVRQAGEAPSELVVVPAAGPVKAVRAHKFEWAVDRLAPLVTAQEYHAADRLRTLYAAMGGHARIGDYGDGAGRSDPANRLPLTERHESAAREFHMIWRAYAIDGAVRAILWNFVLREAPNGCREPLSAEEFGRLYGGTSDARRARGVADGAIKTALGVLASVMRDYERWRHEQKAQRPSEKSVNADKKRIATDVRDASKPSGSLYGRQWLEDYGVS